MSIGKKEALSVVFNCAAAYQQNFINKSLLFVFTDKHKHVNCLEVTFDASNFQHLTGFVTDPEKISSTDFFNRCLDKRLSIRDFEFDSDGTTPLKMRALPVLMRKDLSANLIGDYNMQQPKLYTEKAVGGVKACMGFVRNDGVGRYVPNTVLEGDVRQKVNTADRIIATFRKSRTDEKYSECIHLAKDIDWSKIQVPAEYAYLPLPIAKEKSSRENIA